MNGYAIVRLGPDEVEEVFAKPQVRHVALMDDGTTFVAFDGDIPVQHGMILEVDTDVVEGSIPWARPQVRRTIIDDRPETIGLFTVAEARGLILSAAAQVSLVGPDLLLVLEYDSTDTDWPFVVWSATSERIYDKRLPVSA